MKRILTIEDHTGIRRMIGLTLMFENYSVLEAASADEGMSIALASHPDLIITDVKLPGRLNGWDFCRLIRQTPQLTYVPIVVLTALDGTQDRQTCDEVGANAFMVKPFRPVELINTVNGLLAHRLKSVT